MELWENLEFFFWIEVFYLLWWLGLVSFVVDVKIMNCLDDEEDFYWCDIVEEILFLFVKEVLRYDKLKDLLFYFLNMEGVLKNWKDVVMKFDYKFVCIFGDFIYWDLFGFMFFEDWIYNKKGIL